MLGVVASAHPLIEVSPAVAVMVLVAEATRMNQEVAA
jgi:hypothetical protein